MKVTASLTVMWLIPIVASAQSTAAPQKPSTYDRVWKEFTEVYVDESNPVIQRVLLSGRFQYDFAVVDSEQGDLSEWNVRRLRIGPRIALFRKLLLHSEVDLDPQRHDPFYLRFTDFYVQWTKNAQLVLTVGKQGAPFTLDGATSSRDLLAIDRSNLANNIWFPQEYLPGVSVSGKRTPWAYRVALYSSGAVNREFGEFTGSTATLGVIGYDFADALGVEEALLTGNYVYQNPDPNNTFTRQLQHVGSINFRFENDRWGWRADMAMASGYLGQSDLWAFQAMPFLNITEKVQVIAQYTFVGSDDVNGVRLATYENRVEIGRGDRFNELYLGANYYFYGQKLKLQSGLQVTDMKDRANDGGEFSGVAWTTGFRIGW